MAKKGKVKISKVKRNNHTTNKMKKLGTLKLQRHRGKVQQKQKQPIQAEPEYSSESESSGNEWSEMLDEEEQKYILDRLAKQPQLLSNIPEDDEFNKPGKKRKRAREKSRNTTRGEGQDVQSEESDLEEKYEKEQAERPAKKTRPLLPIKTKQGVIERAEECDDSEDEKTVEDQVEMDINNTEADSDSGVEHTTEESPPSDDRQIITTVDLMAARRSRLSNDKLRIGALCSSLLENPEKKLKNLYPILYLMEEKLRDGSLNLVSVRKLATISTAEVFRDILPEYRIRHQDYSNVKLKKDTLSLYKYEKELVEFYKRFLLRLEKAAGVLRSRRGDHRSTEPSTRSLALVSLRCMCNLLEAKPNFNFARNIAQSLTPYLDAGPEACRLVTDCFSAVFREDAKGDVTLDIVRLINALVKRRGVRLQPAALECLLALNIAHVELDAQPDLTHDKKQQQKNKKRIINLSKKEKKRAKKLKEVEKELQETEARESESARRKQLTEVTRVAFHILFRLLKCAPRSALLAAVLRALDKFGHVINLEYYSDLVAILSALVRDEEVAPRERLLCVRTALRTLAANEALTLDPARFHAALYGTMLPVHATPGKCGGVGEECSRLVLECAASVFARARRVSAGVSVALAKRLATTSLAAPHHAALAALALLQHLHQQSKALSCLLETDERVGSGKFDPLSESPEHCHAAGATLAELAALARHYHPGTRRLARALCCQRHERNERSPLQMFDDYNGSQMSFNPPIPPPVPVTPRRVKPALAWSQPDFKTYCDNIETAVDMTVGDLSGR